MKIHKKSVIGQCLFLNTIRDSKVTLKKMREGNFPNGYKKRAQSSSRSIKQSSNYAKRTLNHESPLYSLLRSRISSNRINISVTKRSIQKRIVKRDLVPLKIGDFSIATTTNGAEQRSFSVRCSRLKICICTISPGWRTCHRSKRSLWKTWLSSRSCHRRRKVRWKKKWAENVPECSTFEYWKVHVSRTVRIYFFNVRYCSMP